ncbi:NTP transferase domain-containing protein [Candidatus Peregrinibacteria bacterium]|nr:NTP transferase domain-containing protein [Candidatus Peregrinibacteria bacterium]
MKTILLLAGRSRRFWPLAEKSLFPICGSTLAEHQVDTLRKGGCADITLVAGAHNKKELKKLFPDLPVMEQKNLDMGMQGACMSALPKIKNGPVMIVSGNDVIEPDAFHMLRKEASGSKIGGAILARRVKDYFPGGYLAVKNGRIATIVEKPGPKNPFTRRANPLVNIVAHIHNDPAALLSALEKVKNHRDDGYEMALQTLFRERKYRAVPYDGFWQPVKFPWQLVPLLGHFLSGIGKSVIHRTAKIHPSAVIEGNVMIGAGTRVLPHATIIGPCLVGERCTIGNNALVRSSSIGDDCVIGYNTEIKGTALAGSVWTHMTYLGDSIIGKNVSFGGGCITGNLRLDEQEIASSSERTGLMKFGIIVGNDCRFGIQVGTNPGVKVGCGSFIATGAMLGEDIPDGSFVDVKEGTLRIRSNSADVPSTETRCRSWQNL